MKLCHVYIFASLYIINKALSSGSGCSRPHDVPCCYNEYFDPENNTCRECRPGRIGWECKQPCVQGYYGKLCKLRCKCIYLYCDKVEGCLTAATNGMATTYSRYNFNRTKNVDSTTKHGIFSLSTEATERTKTELVFLIKSWEPGYIAQKHGHKKNGENSREMLEYISKHLLLMSISLVLIVSCVFVLILILVYYTWKRTKKPDFPIEMKQSNTTTMINRRSMSAMERGYTPLSNRERQVRSGRQSDYSTPQNLDAELYTSTL